MITIRPSDERGRTKFDWLDSKHTFSFGQYRDPQHMGFGPLRVINDDIFAPGGGFGTHPHREMEIITWVLDGGVEHADSTGAGGVIRPGDVQRTSAGRGIEHSEFNASTTDPLHVLQIWIRPDSDHRGGDPSYEQRHFDDDQLHNTLCRIVSPDGPLTIGQDASLHIARLDSGASVEHAIEPGRGLWVHVARGSVTLNDHDLTGGDGAAVVDEASIRMTAQADAEVLVFDLPM